MSAIVNRFVRAGVVIFTTGLLGSPSLASASEASDGGLRVEVIAAYNLFHSPLLVATFMLLGFTAWRRGRRWGAWFFWLSCAALLHTFSDIPLHVDDGPLLLFPLNWELRYRSPLSYWDPAFYGRQWTLFEHALDLLLLLYLGAVYRPLFRAWRERRRTAKTLDNPGALEAPGS